MTRGVFTYMCDLDFYGYKRGVQDMKSANCLRSILTPEGLAATYSRGEAATYSRGEDMKRRGQLFEEHVVRR